ncbi:uracil permease [Vulcanibacillus modesticaldus]|uniref:Uracil permease n=1 Tax=Vulcanibacillus modesticaldus TaxID=337097 RepID=A0A1D2YTS9_9BACI|nr:uracil permease [Vulcanibacillus modesticaldus]OEF99104.1 uracil permease [Vulcanibacillus modesticaldus]
MMKNQMIDVHEVPSPIRWFALSFQHLFAMFGATILVPILTGLSPSIALLSSGLGTIAYLIITKGKIPAYLGSSFAFIAPIITISNSEGVGAAMFGALLAGVLYGIVALLIYNFGLDWINRLLPPVVIGPVIIVIGLGLAGVAVDMAMNMHIDGNTVYSLKNFLVALATLSIAIIASTILRGFFNVIPILLGIVGGYVIALLVGIVDLTPIYIADTFALPTFTTPVVSWKAALIMVPVALVTITEHIGHLMVQGSIMDRDLVKDPGLHRSLLGDGVATAIASLIGGPPNTTYGENIGVMAITRVYSVFVIGGAAIFAMGFAFFGKLGALISTIPTPVMGGVSILLFGIIASTGLRMLVENKIDFSDKRNLVISSVVLVIGIGGAALKFEGIHLEVEGMALATIVGIILNLVLPSTKEEVDSQRQKDKVVDANTVEATV